MTVAETPTQAGEAALQWAKPSEISVKMMNELELKFKIPRGKIVKEIEKEAFGTRLIERLPIQLSLIHI